MAVTYTDTAWALIEQPLTNLLNDDFNEVYASPRFKKLGNEFIRVNIESSTEIMTTGNFEQREYIVMIRYYLDDSDIEHSQTNGAIKRKIDRLKKKLLDSISVASGATTHSGKWDSLIIDTVEYDVQDEENEDDENLYIAQLMCSIQSTYTFE